MQQRRTYDATRVLTASSPRLAYTVNGAVDGAAVVLLHGVGSSASTWKELTGHLPAEFSYVAADYPGHGRSEPVPGPYSLEMFVADHLRLLDELGIGSAHLVGFSVGAIFAQAIAARHPERTRSAVLLSSIAGRTPAQRERALARLAVIREQPPARSSADSTRRWFTEQFRARRPDLVAAEQDIVAAVDHASYAATYEVLATTDLIDQADQVTVPTLIVTGEHDEGSTPQMSALLHERIADSHLVVLPGVKHYIHIERAQVLGDLLGGFLSSPSVPTDAFPTDPFPKEEP